MLVVANVALSRLTTSEAEDVKIEIRVHMYF